MYYWPPDNLEWFPLQIGFSDFFRWTLTRKLEAFYQDLRWETWQPDTEALPGDSCFSFYPFLWTKEGSLLSSDRAVVPVQEAFDLKVELLSQLTKK